MRFAVKSSLGVLVAYLLVVGGWAFWLDRQLGEASELMMEETARVVGREVAVAITEASPVQVLARDRASRRQLVARLRELTEHSEMVESIDLVDDQGRLLASTKSPEIQATAATPAEIFQGRRKLVLYSYPGHLFGGATYNLFVPLETDGKISGYLRLSLANERIGALYGRVRAQVWGGLLIGLIAVGTVGVLMHGYLTHRGAALAAAFERAARGQEIGRREARDEFANAFAVAGRLGRELSQARERGSEAERRLSAIGEALSVGVLILGSDQELDFASPVAYRLLGVSGAKELAERWSALAEELAPAFERSVGASGGEVTVDVDVAFDGDLARLRFEVMPLAEEECEGFLVLIKDRVVAEAVETDMRLAAQLRSLTRLYTAVAHDLRAPLNAMSLNLELLDRTVKEAREAVDREKSQRYMGVIRNQLSELDRSLKALLLPSGDDGEPMPFDICETLRDIEVLLRPQARRQRVDVRVETPADATYVRGQRDRLKQALLNLSINGLEAMPDGGELLLSVERRNGEARLHVADTGGGIPPEIMARIWDMNFTTKSTGTGVGLSVARSVVESLGGEIVVESVPGSGSRFSIHLPRHDEET